MRHFLWYIFDISWQTHHWPIPLELQPAALIMGISRHGALPQERYALGGIWRVHCYRCLGWLRVQGQTFPIRPGFVSVTLPHLSPCAQAIPAMQDAGDGFSRLCAEFEKRSAFFVQSAPGGSAFVGHPLAAVRQTLQAIAEQVGRPDLHQFNQTLRRTFGASPAPCASRLKTSRPKTNRPKTRYNSERLFLECFSKGIL